MKGPVTERTFLISQLVGSIRSTDQEKGFGKARPFPGNRLYAVTAVRRKGLGNAEYVLDMDSAVDLTEEVRDGMLVWDVPEGIWCIFDIFETRNDGGRMFYMNLLNPASVALNIEVIYEPHYTHLKEEAGKTSRERE